MGKVAFHIYNIIILVLLMAFNCLLLLAFSIGEGGMGFSDLFSIIFSFIIWGIFYRIQFIRPAKSWRIIWFVLMVIILYLWQTGYGMMISSMLF